MTYSSYLNYGVGVNVAGLAVRVGVREGVALLVGTGVLVSGTDGVAVCTPSMENM